MTEAAFGRFTYNQYEGTSILVGGRKVEVLLPPVTLSLGVVQNRKNEWLEVEVLQYSTLSVGHPPAREGILISDRERPQPGYSYSDHIILPTPASSACPG